jgi:hypothetical protein
MYDLIVIPYIHQNSANTSHFWIKLSKAFNKNSHEQQQAVDLNRK